MLIEMFRMFFGGKRAEPQRGMWWWFVLACGVASLALGLLAAFAGVQGGYPWHTGRVFLALSLLWIAAVIFRTRFHWRPAALVGRWLDHLATLFLIYLPGLAVLWYSIEAPNEPSVNSRGDDVCSTSGAQYCVSGPRALIPWAIILLVFAFVTTWFLVWKWSTNGGRTSRLVKPVYDIADSVRRVESVIPPNDPGAPAFSTQAAQAGEAISELMGTMMHAGSVNSLVETLSKIAPTTVINLRHAIDNAPGPAPAAATPNSATTDATASDQEPQVPPPVANAPVATPAPDPTAPQEWPPRRTAGRELNAFANIPRPDSPAPGQPRRDAKPDSSPVEAEDAAPSDPNEAVHALGELVQLHRSGEITDAEFDTMKARLIGGGAANAP